MAVVRLKYAIVFLGVLFFLVPSLASRPMDYMGLLIGAGQVSLGYIPMIRYQRHPSSVRALLLMMDGMLASLALLLTVGIWNMARNWAENYWLYRDYVYVYVALYVIVFVFFVRSRRLSGNLNDQMAALREHANEGIVTAGELYRLLTNKDDRRAARTRWNDQAMAAIIAPISVGFLAFGALGGRDYFLYACFVVSCLVSPILLAIPIARRIAMRRYLRSHDISIVHL